MTMDWSKPEDRAALIERVGIEEYNRQHEAHREASVVATVAGHKLRSITSQRWGALVQVGDTGMAFTTRAGAEDYATRHPA